MSGSAGDMASGILGKKKKFAPNTEKLKWQYDLQQKQLKKNKLISPH